MKRYKAIIPFIPDMGSVSPLIVTDYYYQPKNQDALWRLNKMREHDCLPPLARLPKGVKFERIADV